MYNLANEHVDLDLERRLLAALAADEELRRTCRSKTLPEAWAVERETWLALAAADAAGIPAELPPWEPSQDPAGDLDRLVDLMHRRLAAGAVERVAVAIADPGRPGQAALDLMEREARLARKALEEARPTGPSWAADLLPQVLQQARERREQRVATGSSITGIPTGIRALDDALNGLGPGLHLLGGAPGRGKTSLALQVALHAAAEGVAVAYITLENSAHNLAQKALAARARTSPQAIDRGSADLAAVEAAAAALRPTLARLAISEGPASIRVADMEEMLLQAMEHHRVDRGLMVLDYLQACARARPQDVRQAVGALVGELREVAIRRRVPVLALASQNRAAGAYGAGGSGGAGLDSLAESAALEYGADTLSVLTTDEKRQPSTQAPGRAVLLNIAKNRHGAAGLAIPLLFRPDHGLFQEVREERGR